MRKGPVSSKFAIAAALTVLSVCCTGDSAYTRTPLRGSTSLTEVAPPTDIPYYPRQQAIRKADKLAREYKLKAAEVLYRQTLKEDPRNAGAWNGLGKITVARTTSSNENLRERLQELQDQAIQHFMTALRYEPGYVEAHLNLAGVYMEQGRFGEAWDEIDRALDLNPRDDMAMARKGEWLVRQGRYNESMPALQKAIARNPENVSAHFYLGMAYAARNEMDAALEQFQMAQYRDPDNGSVHYQLGLVYEKQGNGAAAVEHYRQALQMKPELHPARRRLADYLERRGDYAEALSQLKTVLDSSDPDWASTDRVARLSIRNHQPELAVRYYRDWLDNQEGHRKEAQAGLSQAKTQLAKQKRRDDDLISQGEAKRYAEQALHYEPDNFQARLITAKLDWEMQLPKPGVPGKDARFVDIALQQPVYHSSQAFENGMLYLSRYQFREADHAFRVARRTADSPDEQMVFGELFLVKGLPSLAEEAFQQVLARMPDNPSARLGLAKARETRQRSSDLLTEAMLHRDHPSLAIHQAEEALRHNVRNADAHYLLGQQYEKQKNYARAADHYYAYINLNPGAEDYRRVERKIEQLKSRMLKTATVSP